MQLVIRTVLDPTELAGTEIPAGGMVIGLVAAANRDPAQVKEPWVFDVTREPSTSLSFGGGPHFCLGTALARLQGEVLFPRLLRASPACAWRGRRRTAHLARRCVAWSLCPSTWRPP